QREPVDELRVFAAGFFIAVEYAEDVGVGHARGTADDAAVEGRLLQPAFVIEGEQRREHQAVDARIERADAGREFRRQHRHGTVREVGAGAAAAGFAVERGADRDVVADVGDVDLQRVAAVVELLNEYGIVEVASRGAVDGDNGQVA